MLNRGAFLMDNYEYRNARTIATHYQIIRSTFDRYYRYGLNDIQYHLAREYSLKSTPFSKKQLHLFDSKITNPLNYQPKSKAKMTNWVKYFRSILFMGKDGTRYMMKPFYFYRLFITANPSNHYLEDNHINDYVCGSRTNTYLHIHKVMMSLRKRLNRVHSPFHILNDNLVNMFNPKSIFNIHIHGTIFSNVRLNLHQVNTKLQSYLTKHLGYQVNPNVSDTHTPILSKLVNTKTDIPKQVVITPNNINDDTNYRSLAQWLIHSNRSNILALGSKNEDIRAWKHMNDFHTDGKGKYVSSALNTSGYTTFKDVRDVLNPNRIITEHSRYHHIRTKYTANVNYVVSKANISRKEAELFNICTKLAMYYGINSYGVAGRYQNQQRSSRVEQRNQKLVNKWIDIHISKHDDMYINLNGKLNIIKKIALNQNLMDKLTLELVGMYYGGISSLNTKELPPTPVLVATATVNGSTFAAPEVITFRNSKILDQNKKELFLFNSS